jgi:large subunit ribosomal protein L1
MDASINEVLEPMAALEQVVAGAKAKFVESVDVAVNLTVSKKAGNTIETYTVLPNPFKRNVTVIVFTDDPVVRDEAKAAGADTVGCDDVLNAIIAGSVDIRSSIIITTPNMMARLSSKVAKILGPKGKMPSAKRGTLTDKVGLAVREMKAGRVAIKSDPHGTVHVKVGDVSMAASALNSNVAAVMSVVKAAGVGVKNFRIKSAYVNTTMGRSRAISFADAKKGGESA